MIYLLKNYIARFICLTFVFLLLYGQTFIFLPIGISKIILIILLPVLLFWTYSDFKKREGLFSISSIKLYAFWFVVFLFTIFSTLINGTNNFDESSFFYVIVLNITEFLLCGYTIIRLIQYSYDNTMESLAKVLIIVITLQGICIVLSFISIPFRDFINNILPISGNIPEDDLLRMRGFSNSSGATLSIIQSIGFYFSLILSVKEKNIIYRFLYIITMIIQVFAVILAGRSGLIALVFFLLSFPILFYKDSVFKVSFKYSKYLISISALLLCTLFLILNQLDYRTKEIAEEQLVEFAFEPFNKALKGKASASQEDLFTMFQTPDNIKTWLFGDGEYVMEGGANYKGTDSGYMKTLYYFGIIGSICLYRYLFYILFTGSKNINDGAFKRSFIIIAIFLLIFQVKEPFLTKPEIAKMLFVFFFYRISQKNIHRTKKNIQLKTS